LCSRPRRGLAEKASRVRDRFTRSGRRVVTLADEEARSLGHKYVGTEHLLLGLLREQEGVAVRALEALGVAPDRVRERVVHTVGSHEVGTGDHRRPLTPRARRALELASEEALHLGHDYVGAEHLLLGLVRESKGVAAQVLYKLGVDPDGIRREVVRALDSRKKTAEGVDRAVSPSRVMVFRTQVEGLVVQARCGVADEERARPQALRVDLDYVYEAGGEDDLLGTVDYEAVIEGVAGLLEREEFRLLETGARMVGEHILGRFPSIREVTVTVTKLQVPVAREVSGVSVEATFGR
jgi:dihydroneopterin aldolase